MDAIRARDADRLPQPLARQILLEACVAGFVNRAHQALHEIVFAVTRGEADVFGYAAGKRMRAFVESSAVEIEAQLFHHIKVHRALCRHGEWACGCDYSFVALFVLYFCDELRQPLFDLAEDAVDIGRSHTGFKAIHQRVVARETAVVGEQFRFFARQAHYVAKVLQKAAPVVGGALTAPRVFTFSPGQ